MSSAGTGKSYAFVVPRYGKSIRGGAETLVREIAERLAARGDTIEILTTCAMDNRTWLNEMPEAVTVEDGVTVRRFLVSPRDTDVWVPLQIRLSEGMNLTLDEQLQYMSESVNSYGLYTYIDQHAHSYDALFFAPYLFGAVFWASLIHPEKSILIPCLHDEANAYLDITASMFRQVKGCLFNALPEKWLAEDLYGSLCGDEVGTGFIPMNEKEITSLTPYFPEESPYLLYIGRKETGKNVQLLVDYFIRAKESNAIPSEIRLVVAGGGDFSDLGRDDALTRSDIVDLSNVSEQEKQRLIRHSLCLIQPSTNESFSIVIMEAWLLGKPVLVHARSAVTKYHCEESGGGLYFGDLNDFVSTVNAMHGDPTLCSDLGCAGDRYVRQRYNWDAVLYRFDTAVKKILRPVDDANNEYLYTSRIK